MRCDAHVHIVGPADRYPQSSTRTYTAGVANLEALEALGRPHGISRFVIVQPSFYGADNTVLLESLDRLGDRGRGVAVIDPAHAAPGALARMHHSGVRGLRINLYSPMRSTAAISVSDQLSALLAIAEQKDWHLEVIAPVETLLAGADLLGRAKIAIVIDHYGLVGAHAPGSATGRRLLALAGMPHVWTKLSAPYRVSADPLATTPDEGWLRAFIETAPDRCVWGSDWPFTPQHDAQTGAAHELPYRPLSYDVLVREFLAALPPGNKLAERILDANPARLYGFGAH